MKKRLGPAERLYPMPCALVVGGTLEKPAGLAVAWINVVSSTPPTIAMGLRESRNTLAAIRETNSFTVNIPSAARVDEFDFFGLSNGAKTDKFAESGLSVARGAMVEAPIVVECPFNIECRVIQEVPIGSYRLVLGEIVETHADVSILKEPEGDLVNMELLDPLVYIAGMREYRRLGEKVADAYTAGKRFVSPDAQ